MSRLHSSLNSVRNNSGLSEQQWDGQHQPNPTNGNVSSDIDTMLFLKKEPEATESLMAHKNIIGFSFKDCKKCNGLMGVPVTYMVTIHGVFGPFFIAEYQFLQKGTLTGPAN